MCSKKIVLRPKGGGIAQWPPKYATDIDIYSSLQLASLLLELTCHMGSHSVTFHPVEMAFRLYSQQSWQSIKLLR